MAVPGGSPSQGAGADPALLAALLANAPSPTSPPASPKPSFSGDGADTLLLSMMQKEEAKKKKKHSVLKWMGGILGAFIALALAFATGKNYERNFPGS